MSANASLGITCNTTLAKFNKVSRWKPCSISFKLATYSYFPLSYTKPTSSFDPSRNLQEHYRIWSRIKNTENQNKRKHIRSYFIHLEKMSLLKYYNQQLIHTNIWPCKELIMFNILDKHFVWKYYLKIKRLAGKDLTKFVHFYNQTWFKTKLLSTNQ